MMNMKDEILKQIQENEDELNLSKIYSSSTTSKDIHFEYDSKLNASDIMSAIKRDNEDLSIDQYINPENYKSKYKISNIVVPKIDLHNIHHF